MTNSEFEKEWSRYGVKIGEKIYPLKDRYAVCWGQHGNGLLFDVGDWSGEMVIFTVDDGNLLSINPANPTESRLIGQLVSLVTSL